MAAEARLLAILKDLWVLPVDIRLSALGSRLRFRPRAYSYIGSIPFLDLADRPIKRLERRRASAVSISSSPSPR